MIHPWMENMQVNQRAVMQRFITACQKDERIIAAFLGGSYAKGTNDAFSDLDLNLITNDNCFAEFCADRNSFIQQLGEPLSLEDFGVSNIVCYVLDNGVEGDLEIGKEGELLEFHYGPYQVVIDKRRIFPGGVFNMPQPKPAEQTEKLRRMIYWFWHDWMHFTTAIGRGQIWWAQGQLETLRGYCVSLLRLQNDFNDPEAGGEHYFKIEVAVPAEKLACLEVSVVPLDKSSLKKASLVIYKVYKELATKLALEHGIAYPEKLEKLLMKRFEEIS